MDDACARHDFFLLSRHPRSIPPLVRRGVALVVGSTGRRSKGVATGNANELHERRQIEQHTTMVSSCHPLAFARANLVPPSNGVTTNLIESCLCINTAAYVVIDGCALRNGMSRIDQCAFLRDLNVVLFPVLSFTFQIAQSYRCSEKRESISLYCMNINLTIYSTIYMIKQKNTIENCSDENRVKIN